MVVLRRNFINYFTLLELELYKDRFLLQVLILISDIMNLLCLLLHLISDDYKELVLL
jgi:hypothetical protein